LVSSAIIVAIAVSNEPTLVVSKILILIGATNCTTTARYTTILILGIWTTESLLLFSRTYVREIILILCIMLAEIFVGLLVSPLLSLRFNLLRAYDCFVVFCVNNNYYF